MPHLGAAVFPVLMAIVAGTLACAFALVDYRVFGRSSFGVMLLAMAFLMAAFTAYHLLLVVVHSMAPTSVAFGGALETVIGVVAVGVLAVHHTNEGAGDR